MDMLSIIEKKKNAQALSTEEIHHFVMGAAKGTVPDYQLAALLMAIRLNGMTWEETVKLTLAMAGSGDQCDLSSIPGLKVDKHSTGGVGDTTTLVAEPLVSACGVPVAKMSGRGLGHTGGTLDKLESIPGMSVQLQEEAFLSQVKQYGLAVIGQTQNLAPADKTLYALRDVTSTVDSMPLIVSSILSKKIAAGADGIVLDVKTGSGALMQTYEKSLELARQMVRIGNRAGRKTVALITDMNQPLSRYVGNALEVKYAIDTLAGRAKGDLLTVSLELASQMLMVAGKAAKREEALAMLENALASGKGLEQLRVMIQAQGGNPAVCDDPSLLPQAPVVLEIPSPADGYVFRMDTVAIGNIAQSLGAGRKAKDDVINPAVGLYMNCRLGDRIHKGDTLLKLYAASRESAEAAIRACLEAIHIEKAAPAPTKLVYALVTEDGVTEY